MPLLQSELGLPAQLYDRPFGGARVQPRKRLQVAILALVAVALAAPGLCSSARASAWELDPAATRIAFSVKNLSVAYVDGTFRLASGRVVQPGSVALGDRSGDRRGLGRHGRARA